MKQAEGLTLRDGFYRAAASYVEVLKPKETLLLTFIGVSAGVVAAEGFPSLERLSLALLAIALGSAGVNGLTNYLDREVDARMQRTKHRALPSGRISPPEKTLPLIIGLVGIALGFAWWLHPWSFLSGLIGLGTAVVGRKTALCPFLGAISGAAPVAIGWFALNSEPSGILALLIALILLWVPLHVWSIMLAYQEDYLGGGLEYFPLKWDARKAVRLLLVLVFLLYAVSLGLYFTKGFGWLYLAVANLLGIAVVYTVVRLANRFLCQSAWRVYKLTAFPYLGLLFLGMMMDLWIAT